MENNTTIQNRAKKWQIALFPFNNAATNIYFAFYTYFTYFAILYLTGATNKSLAVGGTVVSAGLVLLISNFNAIFAPLMRIFDGVTNPFIGGILDKTRSKFGKFRPFMLVGNLLLALSLLCMMVFFRNIPDSLSWLRWVIYIFSYIIYVIGYTIQCSVTKAGQTCLTSDPKQRSEFVVWNMIGMIGSIVLVNVMAGGVLTNESICGKGKIIYEGGELSGAAYGIQFYNIMVPFVIIISFIYTIMAIASIWEKDNPKYWGASKNSGKLMYYMKDIFVNNKEMRWLVISAGLNKLASTVATSGTVAFLLYGSLMNNYNGLFIPLYAISFIFMGLFFVWGSKVAGAKGQKRGVAQFTIFAFIFYIGVLVLLCLYNHDDPNTYLKIFSTEGGFHFTFNAYTILFIIFFGCGYGAFNCCDNLTIPMIADCTDYETYRSGNYLPGIMGTVFSFIDKLISSLQTILLTVFIVYIVPGLNALPAEETPYMEGMKLSTIICYCLLPMAAWLVTIICMRHYSLSGEKLKEIQAVNAVRKAAIEGGMSQEEAMKTWVTIDQVPEIFLVKEKVKIDKKTNKPKEEKVTIFDKIYTKMFTKCEKITSNKPGSNAIDIPSQYLTNEIKSLMGTKIE